MQLDQWQFLYQFSTPSSNGGKLRCFGDHVSHYLPIAVWNICSSFHLRQYFAPPISYRYADYNQITNITTFGQEAYPHYMTAYYDLQKAKFVPFATVPNLLVLWVHASISYQDPQYSFLVSLSVLSDFLVFFSRYLSNNAIKGIREQDFCNMSVLEELYLDSNSLTEETIENETFACLTSLSILWVSGTVEFLSLISAVFKSVITVLPFLSHECCIYLGISLGMTVNMYLRHYYPLSVCRPFSSWFYPRITSLSSWRECSAIWPRWTDCEQPSIPYLTMPSYLSHPTSISYYIYLSSSALRSNNIISIEDGTFPLQLSTLWVDQYDYQCFHPDCLKFLMILKITKCSILVSIGVWQVTSSGSFMSILLPIWPSWTVWTWAIIKSQSFQMMLLKTAPSFLHCESVSCGLPYSTCIWGISRKKQYDSSYLARILCLTQFQLVISLTWIDPTLWVYCMTDVPFIIMKAYYHRALGYNPPLWDGWVANSIHFFVKFRAIKMCFLGVFHVEYEVYFD